MQVLLQSTIIVIILLPVSLQIILLVNVQIILLVSLQIILLVSLQNGLNASKANKVTPPPLNPRANIKTTNTTLNEMKSGAKPVAGVGLPGQLQAAPGACRARAARPVLAPVPQEQGVGDDRVPVAGDRAHQPREPVPSGVCARVRGCVRCVFRACRKYLFDLGPASSLDSRCSPPVFWNHRFLLQSFGVMPTHTCNFYERLFDSCAPCNE